MGSCSLFTRACMRASRTMKLVADVSSSSSSTSAPTSSASTMFAAWLVLPLASSERKERVLRPRGRLVMNGLMSTASTLRPSSARIFTAPAAVTNRELARSIGRVLRRPAFLPTPGFALKLLLGEMSTLVLDGQRAVPARLLERGFEFRFTEVEDALRDLTG